MSSSAPIPGPVLGPCTSWIHAADVGRCCKVPSGIDPDWLETLAVEASMALFEISGRRFTGSCKRKVRPCRDQCACFRHSPSLGGGPWYWTTAWGGGQWGWRNECGDSCGCGTLSAVELAGYPVRQILEVKIDGQPLAPLDPNGHPNWRLDRWQTLVRMDDPGPPARGRFWPSCQDLSLDDSQPGTFSITYLWGVDPPQLGRDAAAAITCQLLASCTGQDCQLPAGVTKVTRQGVEVERGLLANWFDSSKPTGLVPVDLFLKAYWRTRGGRVTAVFSPDLQAFAQPEGISG